MTDYCLFSAPFSFLPDHVLDPYKAFMPMEFREIWKFEDLVYDENLIAWVMNPGQSFIINGEVLDFFPNVKVLSTPSTGSNHIDRKVCRQRGVAVYSLIDNREILDTISASAEFTFLLLLNTLRRLDLSLLEVTEGRWRANEDDMRGNELAGKQVGLVGLGRIGKRMARWCQAFDANVAYYDPYVESESVPAWSLNDIFERSDAVCICPALTDETAGMIDYDLMKRLPQNACLVNTSRGEVLNENDLAKLLSERADIRVAVDVLAGEVTNTHHRSKLLEFHRQGRIVITPHIAGATVESQGKAATGALMMLQKHFENY